MTVVETFWTEAAYLATTATSAGLYLWAAAALVRKLVRARRQGAGRRRVVAYAAFLVVLALLATATVMNVVAIGHGGLAATIALAVHAAHTLALVVAYVEFAPEPTTVQVRLVGFSLTAALLLLLAVTEALASQSDQFEVGLPALDQRAFVFESCPPQGHDTSCPYTTRRVPTRHVVSLHDTSCPYTTRRVPTRHVVS